MADIMTPVEKITAAIARLEQLKADSTPGWWETSDELWDGAGRWEILSHTANHAEFVTLDGDGIGSLQNQVNAELIVTLHRTLDAQLAILRGALGGARDLDMGHTPDEPASTVDALNLADAILGES